MTPGSDWCRSERAIVSALRLLPPGAKGKARLARWLLPGLQARKECVIEVPDGARFLMPSAREPIAFHCLIDGVYEPELVCVLRRFLKAGGTFVDVGANVGVFTVVGSRLVGPTGRVLAIEASPGIRPFLEHNLKANSCSNSRMITKAVADNGPGKIDFWQAPGDRFGMGSLAPQFAGSPVAVDVDTIDHILAEAAVDRVDVLKIDVEGFEAAAFRGARALLQREARPVIVFEFVDWAERRSGANCADAQRLLLDAEYELHLVDRRGQLQPLEDVMTIGGANIVAIPSNRADDLGRNHRSGPLRRGAVPN